MPLVIDYNPVVIPPQAEEAEPRPRDFAGRIRRRDTVSLARSLPHARQRRRRAWSLAAITALGLGSAPLAMGGSPVEEAFAANGMRTAMAFEQPGQSFPGSAFYWLDSSDSGVLAPKAALAAWESHAGDETFASLASPAGPAARPLLARSGGEDYARALQCLTSAIYYEAASEADAGQRAVAQVVLNRVAHPAYPNTVCGVVYQGSERRTGCQFTFTCDGSLARRPSLAFWNRARGIAADALAGYVYAPVGLATHYHTTAIHPYWADSLAMVGTIGAHRFYRWGGAAGRPAAFNAVYAGREPAAAPHPRTVQPAPAIETDPLLLAKAFEQGRIAATTSAPASAASVPAYAPALEQRGGEALFKAQGLPASGPISGSGAVRPEYENAGKWIAQPGG